MGGLTDETVREARKDGLYARQVPAFVAHALAWRLDANLIQFKHRVGAEARFADGVFLAWPCGPANDHELPPRAVDLRLERENCRAKERILLDPFFRIWRSKGERQHRSGGNRQQ